MEREFIFKDGKFFEVKEKEEIDKMDMEEILEEMEWISEMFEKGVESFDKIVDKMVKEKKKFKVDKEDIIRYYKDTDWEREYLGERFYEEIKKEVER